MIKKIKKIFKGKFLSKTYMLTFTKKWVTRLMWFSILAVALNYAMAIFSFNLGIEPETITAIVSLSKHIITMIIGVMLGYMVKAFWETYMEEKNKISSDKNINVPDDEDDETTEEDEE